MKANRGLVAAVAVIACLVSWLVFAGVRDSMVYYVTVDELFSQTPEVYGEKVRVSGTVVAGSIRNEIDDSLRFTMEAGSGKLDVEYGGVVPDIFADGVEAVVEGELSSDNVFRADLLLAKCPTKYESEDSLYERKKS